MHGSAGVCVTADGHVVLISQDGVTWDLPAGRPESDEDWRATLDREVLEEACASITDATLLGFARSACIEGSERSLVLVRAFLCAHVEVHKWEPQFETTHRLLVPPDEAHRLLLANGFPAPFCARVFEEVLSYLKRCIESRTGGQSP